MKSPFNFLIKPVGDKRYNNTKDYGGIKITVNTSEEDFRYTNRLAEVLELPIGYDGNIKKGAILVVHHNCFKVQYSMQGARRNSKSYIDEDTFFVDSDQFFMYDNGEGWIAHDRFCFVKPIPAIKSYIHKPFSDEPLMGEMKYSNDYLRSKGVNQGDTVVFAPDSEYKFEIDGQTMYRIFDSQIVIKLN